MTSPITWMNTSVQEQSGRNRSVSSHHHTRSLTCNVCASCPTAWGSAGLQVLTPRRKTLLPGDTQWWFHWAEAVCTTRIIWTHHDSGSQREERESVTILAEIINLDYHEKLGSCKSNPNFSWSGRNVYEYRIFTKACLSICIPSNNSHWPIVKTTIQ